MTQVAEILIAIAVGLFVLLVALVLMVAAVGILALGAWGWSNAIAAAHRARSHGLTVAEQEAINTQAHDALDEARDIVNRRRMPTDREIRESVIAEREYDDREHNTMESNENIEEQPLIPTDEMYVRDSEDAFSAG